MKKILKILAVICMCMIILFGWGCYHFIWDTQSIPKGDLVKTISSPEKGYIANVYDGGGGATVDSSVIVEIENVVSHKKRNIYFEYHCNYEDIDIKWLSETDIQVNGKKLNINRDVYDWRHE